MLVFAALLVALFGYGLGRVHSTAGWRHWGPGIGIHHPVDPDRAARRVDRRLNRMLRHIDATPEQRARISAIAQAAVRDLAAMHERHRTARDRAAALLAADPVDRAGLEQLRVEQMALADAASKRLVQAIADASAVLTPAQRAQLRDRWRRWHRHG